MLHPLFSTLVTRPDLVADHVAGYAQLFHEEASCAGAEAATRVAAWLAVVMLGVLFAGLAGVALMLGFMRHEFHWILLAVPGVALLAMAVAALKARRPLSSQSFPELRAQIDSDVRALRSVA